MNANEKHPGTSARPISRRQLLGAAAAAGTMMVVPRHVLGGAEHTPPSEKLNIAGVGIGGQGGEDLKELSSQNIVALADVDWDYAAHTFKQYPGAKKYKDFRRMLDKEKGIDAVVVGTPDHAHAIVSMAAIKLGKHVYCEKPLTRTVFEARMVAKAAREHKVATQMGNQGMAFEGNRLINEWINDGAIGPVHEAHVWSDRPTHRGKVPLYWAQGSSVPRTNRRCHPLSTGTCGSVRPRGDRITPPTPRFGGEVGGISAPAVWRYGRPQYRPGVLRPRPRLADERLGQLDGGVRRDAAFGLLRPLRVSRAGRQAARHASLVRRRTAAAAAGRTRRRPRAEPGGRRPPGGRKG